MGITNFGVAIICMALFIFKYLYILELLCGSVVIAKLHAVITNFGVAIVKSLHWGGLVSSLSMFSVTISFHPSPCHQFSLFQLFLRELYPLLGLGFMCYHLH